MLLIHQAGSVKVGEVVRYTVTYTPSSDRILPSPSQLYVKVRNTSAVPLRAAYLHGPYTLHVCTYPSTFNPNQKFEAPTRDGVPEFEPNLKAGGAWHAKLNVPEEIRESGEKANIKRNTDGSPRTCTWIIEVASQILFSSAATVNYELLVGRDERSLDLGFAAIAGQGHGEPGQIKDFQIRDKEATSKTGPQQPKGVYSKAVDLMVEDTTTLWNKPPLPQWGEEKSSFPTDQQSSAQSKAANDGSKRKKKPKKVHLVILTHGLHSNIGADMLFMKESIDAAARESREAAKEARQEQQKRTAQKRRREEEAQQFSAAETMDGTKDGAPNATAPLSGGQDRIADDERDEGHEDDDDEVVIVRGFSGNACRTDRGIQYLGKRLAKFVLTTTYPDQPFLPASKTRSFSNAWGALSNGQNKYGAATHQGSSIHRKDSKDPLPYTFTGISFIGHSLGGLVQTYAVAYIHKHSPGFFDQIQPRNFIAMASPFLGLSNENPLYIKFALDFGVVGRTGQDLGLTWRAPTIARSGWSAMIAGFGGNNQQEKKQEQQGDPRAKPLLRILPTGPAHHVLKMFRNRTLYANAVNDGIVPLRTSSLLFLDWRGLDKVQNARRENGLIGTMAAFGWAELTGANTTSHRPPTASSVSDAGQSTRKNDDSPVGSPPPTASPPPRIETDLALQDVEQSQSAVDRSSASPLSSQFLGAQQEDRARSTQGRLQSTEEEEDSDRSYTLPSNPLTEFINYFRPGPGKAHPSHPQRVSKKAAKTYHRAQTVKAGEEEPDDPDTQRKQEAQKRPVATRGDSLEHDPRRAPPPKTSIFDAASDILNPPIPPQSWLTDPTKRSRSIFHDRIYHPSDVPPPPPRRPRLGRSFSSNSMRSNSSKTGQPGSADSNDPTEADPMRVEEKIARAYHSGMSWRKVLVRLEPDAHNNMIVRRMFANAYGWDVVKHVCDTHFAHTFAAETLDEDEPQGDRAKPLHAAVTEDAEEVHGQTSSEPPYAPPESKRDRTVSEIQEVDDQVADLRQPIEGKANLVSGSGSTKTPKRHGSFRSTHSQESAIWDDAMFEEEDDDDETEHEQKGPFDAFQRFWQGSPKPSRSFSDHTPAKPDLAQTLTEEPAMLESHRGLGVIREPAAAHRTADAESVEPLVAGEARPADLHDALDTPSDSRVTTGVGLQKPPEAHVDGSPTSPRAGVTEHVARLSMGSPPRDTEK